MPRQIARDLAAAHGESDQGRALDMAALQHRREIVSEGIVVVATGRMRRLAKAAAVVGDDPVAGFQQRQRLVFEHVAGQRPAVDQNHRAAGSDILHVQFDFVLGLDECHLPSLRFVPRSNRLVGPSFPAPDPRRSCCRAVRAQ